MRSDRRSSRCCRACAATRPIVHVHGLDWQRGKWSRLASQCIHAAEYSAVYFPNRTIAISAALKRYFEAKYQRPIDYVPTGVEAYEDVAPQEIRNWGLERDSYVLFLSRLVPEKGCHYLIEAYERLAPTKRLVIAGPSTGAEARTVRRCGRPANPNIVFTGSVSGRLLHELFSNAYAYVLPSEVEGLPHALLQALSHGRCVLASDIERQRRGAGRAAVSPSAAATPTICSRNCSICSTIRISCTRAPIGRGTASASTTPGTRSSIVSNRSMPTA